MENVAVCWNTLQSFGYDFYRDNPEDWAISRQLSTKHRIKWRSW